MKHLPLIVASLFSLSTQAQQFGIFGGLNNSSVYGKGTYHDGRQTSITAGVYYQAGPVDIEAAYSQKGTKWCLGGPAGFDGYNGNFYFLQLSAIPTVKTGDVRLGVGPYAAYLLNPNTLTNWTDERRWAWRYGVENQYTHRLDYGVKAIASVDLHGLVLQASAEQSIRPITVQPLPPTDYNPARQKLFDSKAKYFLLQLALKVPFNNK